MQYYRISSKRLEHTYILQVFAGDAGDGGNYAIYLYLFSTNRLRGVGGKQKILL